MKSHDQWAEPVNDQWAEPITDRLGVHSLAGWMSRSLGAIRADLEYVDAGSLDVLLYCPDEIETREPRDVKVD